MTEHSDLKTAGTRGPAEHSIRDQIVDAADQYFRRYGYGKTTVSDLAKAVGFSKAYIYKFFDSKQAIGEAICTSCLDRLLADGQAAIAQASSPTDKLRRFLRAIVDGSVNLMFEDRELYDIAAHSSLENWKSSQAYVVELNAILGAILTEGRLSGEFERKTPLDETVGAISYAIQPFVHPILLEKNLDNLPDGLNQVTGLILRSLAP